LGATMARRVWVGGLAALMMLALGFPGPVSWLALYRVDTLGVAFALASVAALRRSTRPAVVVVAACLAALAILTKQTLFAAAVAGTLWMWSCSWRQAVLFASVE